MPFPGSMARLGSQRGIFSRPAFLLRRQRLGLGGDVLGREIVLKLDGSEAGLAEVDGLVVDLLDELAAVGADVGDEVRAVVGHGPLGDVGLVGGVAFDRAIENVEGVEDMEPEVDRVVGD